MSSIKIFKKFINGHTPDFIISKDIAENVTFCTRVVCKACIAIAECREIDYIPVLNKEELKEVKIEHPEVFL